MALSSTDINLLVYRYLQESGFSHTSFSFAYESQICAMADADVRLPPGALIAIIQKGLQYMDLESHLEKEGLSTEEKATVGLRASVKPRQKRTSKSDEIEIKPRDVLLLDGHQKEVLICAWNPRDDHLASGSGDATARIWNIGAMASNGMLPSGSTASSEDAPPPRKRKNNHSSSNNSNTSRNNNRNDSSIITRPSAEYCSILRHVTKSSKTTGETDSKAGKTKDVTTLDWKSDGTALATGCYDGRARVWSKGAKLLFTLVKHKGPVFALKWNKAGTYLLSGSVDTTAIVWDADTGKMIQQFQFHDAPILDVSWMDNETFATCSIDSTVKVCRVGSEEVIKVFRGHKNEVNAIQWAPYASPINVLASCSDDHTAKIWSLESDKCIHTLGEHTKEIYQIQWCPKAKPMSKATSKSPKKENLIGFLATASFDHNIKVWNVATGECHYTLKGHACPVYSLSFHPQGKYLASGSFDRCLNIWSMEDGQLVKKYSASKEIGGIFEVSWNRTGNKVAACFSRKKVAIVEFQN